MEIDKTLKDLDINDSSSDLEMAESFSSVVKHIRRTLFKRVLGQKNIITPKLIFALENCKVCDRGKFILLWL
jgi:hypothetical protein